MNQLFVIDGVSVRQDFDGRYCLNDLHKAAVSTGANERTKEPGKFLASPQTVELITELETTQNLGIKPVNTLEGRGGGTYVCKELVYAYAMWISPRFNLKVIRTFDAVASQSHNPVNPVIDKMQAGVILLDFMQRALNLSSSSVLGACQKLQNAAGLPDLAPQYAIDAPVGIAGGSSDVTLPLSALLKKNNIQMTAAKAYQCLQSLSIVERMQRPSTSKKAKNGVKEFWSVTAEGGKYGKNITSPANPRETQPHFFVSRTAELIQLLLNREAA